jgi:hypothetical protein
MLQADRGHRYTPTDLSPQVLLRFDRELDNTVKVNLTEVLKRRADIATERDENHN